MHLLNYDLLWILYEKKGDLDKIQNEAARLVTDWLLQLY